MARKRPIIRSRFDTNGTWGDLAATDAVDYRRTWLRSVSRRLFVGINFALTIVLVVLSLLAWNLIEKQPNVPDVAQKALDSMFEVDCAGSSGSGVAMVMPLPKKYKTGVVTAAHVVEECKIKSKITLVYKGRNYKGILAKKDPEGKVNANASTTVNDVALIYLEQYFPALEQAPEAELGASVVVVGNPWGYTNYVTVGVVSNVSADEYMTDAAVNEGNSGGPMLDNQGRVLGLVDSKTYQGNIFDENPSGIYDYADGLSTVKRLRVMCEHVFSGAASCPFKY
jgi:S1-C subfamily serine protease